MFRIQKALFSLITVIFCTAASMTAPAQETLVLNFDDAIAIAFERSFEVSRVKSDYLRNSLHVRAQRASLKSYSTLRANVPALTKSINRYITSSGDYISVDTQKETMETNYSISQPIITNGTFSLNFDLLTLNQKGDNRTYKDKLFMKFEQPIFTRNQLQKNIWRAEEQFKQTEYNSIDQLLRQYDTFNRLFYDLLRLIKEIEIDSLIADITSSAYEESVVQLSEGRIDSSEVLRLEVEYLLNQSRFLGRKVERYSKELEFKQRSGIDLNRPVHLEAELTVEPVDIDEDFALEKGLVNRPSILRKEIEVEFNRDRIEEVKSYSEFRGSIESTYGIERVDEQFSNIFQEFDKTQSFNLNLSTPVWDNGRNKYQVEAAVMEYDKTLLELDNDKLSRANEIRRSLRDVNSSQNRALTLQRNQERAKEYYDQSIEQFRNNEISARDLTRALEEYRNVQNLYLDAFIDFNQAKVQLGRYSLWDFENNISMTEKYMKYLRTDQQ
ncbi:TolC family protein [candidate division KSB1 bacterium]